MNPAELSWERSHHQEGGDQADKLNLDTKPYTQAGWGYSEEGRVPVTWSIEVQNISELREKRFTCAYSPLLCNELSQNLVTLKSNSFFSWFCELTGLNREVLAQGQIEVWVRVIWWLNCLDVQGGTLTWLIISTDCPLRWGCQLEHIHKDSV